MEATQRGKLVEAWLTSKVLLLGWDWSRLEKAMAKQRKSSEVAQRLAWTRRKSPEQLAAEAKAAMLRKEEIEARTRRLAGNGAAAYERATGEQGPGAS
jgi:hypothetical protein|eukprot:COSAG01_NODE_2773_length_7101_cov_5.678806_9_plen_98_part_00